MVPFRDYIINGELTPFCTPEEVTAITGVDATGSELLIAGVSDIIRQECGWHIAPSLECSYEPLSGGRLFLLPALWVTEVSSVFDKLENRKMEQGEYEVARNGIVRRCCFQNWGEQLGRYTVTYKAGYDVVPDILKTICAQASASAIKSPVGIASESVGDVSVSYSTTGRAGAIALTSREMELLSPFRLQTRL